MIFIDEAVSIDIDEENCQTEENYWLLIVIDSVLVLLCVKVIIDIQMTSDIDSIQVTTKMTIQWSTYWPNQWRMTNIIHWYWY